MTAIMPVELTRTTTEGQQRCGNQIQIEDQNGNPVNAANPVPVTGVVTNPVSNPIPVVATREIVLLSNEIAPNDAIFTVPNGYEYQILWVWVEYTCDGNAGNRQLEVSLLDAANDEIGSILVGATQAAGLTRYYMLAPTLADMAAFRDVAWLMTPFPPTVYLSAGQSVRVFDNNVVSVGDAMVIQIQVIRRAV
jgi:hypothetical protein